MHSDTLINELTPAQLLFENMACISSPPSKEDFEAMDSQKSAMLPLLLEELRAFSDDPEIVQAKGEQYIRHVLAIFLLAYFRNNDAYPYIIKLLSHKGGLVLDLTGEVFSEALGRILASVYNGDISLVKRVVENPKLNPWIRSGALDCLMVLWKEDLMPRSELVAYLQVLMTGKLERHPSYVWDAIALIAYEIHPAELQDLLTSAIQDKLIEPVVLTHETLAICLKEPFPQVDGNKEQLVGGLMKSPSEELTWWLYPDRKTLQKGKDYASLDVPIVDKEVIPGERISPMGWRSNTVVHYEKKPGRNAPCLCGSGKKYKYCCLRR